MSLSPRGGRIVLIVLLVLLFGLASAWHWSPMSKWLDVKNLSEWMNLFRVHPWGPVIALGAYLGGSIVLFPMAVLIAATIFVYGPLLGFAYALMGSALAAALTYQIGHWLGYETVRQIAGKRIGRVRGAATRHGFTVALFTHLIPVAPFTIVNLIAGATNIRFKDFALGTILGMLPGIAAITLLERQLQMLIRNPGMESYALFAAVVVAVVIGTVWGQRRLSRFDEAGEIPKKKR